MVADGSSRIPDRRRPAIVASLEADRRRSHRHATSSAGDPADVHGLAASLVEKFGPLFRAGIDASPKAAAAEVRRPHSAVVAMTRIRRRSNRDQCLPHHCSPAIPSSPLSARARKSSGTTCWHSDIRSTTRARSRCRSPRVRSRVWSRRSIHELQARLGQQAPRHSIRRSSHGRRWKARRSAEIDSDRHRVVYTDGSGDQKYHFDAVQHPKLTPLIASVPHQRRRRTAPRSAAVSHAGLFGQARLRQRQVDRHLERRSEQRRRHCSWSSACP